MEHGMLTMVGMSGERELLSVYKLHGGREATKKRKR